MFFSKEKKFSYTLHANAFLLGSCSLAYEYNLSKLGTDLLGNSITQWSMTIATMMLFMGIGSDFQKRLGNTYLTDTFIHIEVLLGIIGAFAPFCILYSFGESAAHWNLIQKFFVAFIGFLIGFELPILVRLNQFHSKNLSHNIGSILRMDYIGAMAGALLWIFLLVPHTDLTTGSLYLACINITVALFSTFALKQYIKNQKIVLLSCCFGFSLLALGFYHNTKWIIDSHQKLFQHPIIYNDSSPYQHVVITESPSKILDFYINGNLQFSSFDEHIYHENLVHPVMHIAPSKKHVLILGGGDGLALRELLKYPEVEEVTLCDLDPLITELASTHPKLVALNEGSLLDSRVHTVHHPDLESLKNRKYYLKNHNKTFSPDSSETISINIMNIDAREFLNEVPGKFDVVIADFPDPNSPELSSLYSTLFYSLVKRKLTPGGIFVQQSGNIYFTKQSFLSIGTTLSSEGYATLPYHDYIPSLGDWGFWMAGSQEYYKNYKFGKKLKNIESFVIHTKYLDSKLINRSMIFPKNFLFDQGEINTIFNHKIYSLYIKGWYETL